MTLTATLATKENVHRWWKTKNTDRRRLDFQDLIEKVARRFPDCPGTRRMIRDYATQVRLSHPEERAALHKNRVTKDQEALDLLICSLLSVPLRPMSTTEIFDDVFEDALQSSVLAMIEYLERIEIGSPTHWQSLVGFVPMNARFREAWVASSATNVVHGRSQKRVLRRFTLEPDLLDLEESEMLDAFSQEAQEDVLELRNCLRPLPLDVRPEEAWDPCAEVERSVELEKIAAWIEAHMPERHMRVFEMRYLAETPESLTVCGEVLGVTAERIRQIEKEVLAEAAKAYQSDLQRQPRSRRKGKPVPIPE